MVFTTRLAGLGGPAAFQRRLALGLKDRGVEVTYGTRVQPQSAVLVIGGSRNLTVLNRARRHGVRIVQRLNGINWLHRRLRTGIRHYLRAERNNLLLRIIRSRLADHIVYQSEFARTWWESRYGSAKVPSTVVRNAVPLEVYSPQGAEEPPTDRVRVLMVEGNYAGGYEIGLQAGIDLSKRLAERSGRKVQLSVAGRAPRDVRELTTRGNGFVLDWRGSVDPEQIPSLNRSAHLLFAGDPNPACPNSVIEAMACGLPVVAYETGALPELVQGDAGRLAPYGGDPWRLDPPDVASLAEAAVQVLDDQPRYRAGARARAVEGFGLGRMVDGFLAALEGA